MLVQEVSENTSCLCEGKNMKIEVSKSRNNGSKMRIVKGKERGISLKCMLQIFFLHLFKRIKKLKLIESSLCSKDIYIYIIDVCPGSMNKD